MKHQVQAIRAIQADATLTKRLVDLPCDPNGRYVFPKKGAKKLPDMCVIGSLYIAAGGTYETLAQINDTCMGSVGDVDCRPIVRKIKAHFGLTQDEQDDLQGINDEHTGTKERRRALITFLTTL